MFCGVAAAAFTARLLSGRVGVWLEASAGDKAASVLMLCSSFPQPSLWVGGWDAQQQGCSSSLRGTLAFAKGTSALSHRMYHCMF
jgi:hypothetical protein